MGTRGQVYGRTMPGVSDATIVYMKVLAILFFLSYWVTIATVFLGYLG